MRLICLTLFWACLALGAEKQPQKWIQGVPLDPEPSEEDETDPQNAGSPLTVALLTTTPLLNVNSYEQIFSTFLPQLLVGFPASSLSIETGVRASVSRLNFGTAGSDFTHFFFDVPLRFLTTIIITPKANVSLVLGFIIRALEYDTRSTTDGGWGRTNSSANLLGEFGLSFRFKIGTVSGFRVDVTTAQMGAGLDFAF